MAKILLCSDAKQEIGAISAAWKRKCFLPANRWERHVNFSGVSGLNFLRRNDANALYGAVSVVLIRIFFLAPKEDRRSMQIQPRCDSEFFRVVMTRTHCMARSASYGCKNDSASRASRRGIQFSATLRVWFLPRLFDAYVVVWERKILRLWSEIKRKPIFSRVTSAISAKYRDVGLLC